VDQQIHNDIEDVVNRFDFHRVRLVMEYLDWHWHDADIPTQLQLYERSTELLWEAYKNVEGYIPFHTESGGLRATCALVTEDDHNYYLFSLDFVVTSSDNS
jgi:hypothetical protein